jgi:quinol monooxygenase YgiN
MLFVRLSLMQPVPGKAAEVAAMMDDLVDYYAKQPGWIAGYKLSAADEVGDIGRITIWRSIEDADVVAQSNHVMSKRAELMPLIEEGTHEERSFNAEEESKLLSRLLRKVNLA